MDGAAHARPWEPAPPWGTEAAFLLIAVDFTLILFLPFAWTLPVRAAVALAFPAAFLLRGRRTLAAMGLQAGRGKEGLKACAAAVALTVAALAAGAGVFLALRALGIGAALPPPGGGGGGRLVALLLTVGAYPVLEEWIYRGILYPPLENRTGPVPAIVISGLVFQALHLAYGRYLPHYFFGGMILAWSFRRSRSLLYPVLLHALWNLVVSLFDMARADGLLAF